MTYRAIFVIIAVFVFFPIAQMRAEVKEPFAVVELGAATERSFQEGTYSIGPSASVEFPVIKDWLEIETGISPLFRPAQTEWQADLLFKKPFTINEHVEFMISAGLSASESCVAVIARTDPNDQESVVLLPELDGVHGP